MIPSQGKPEPTYHEGSKHHKTVGTEGNETLHGRTVAKNVTSSENERKIDVIYNENINEKTQTKNADKLETKMAELVSQQEQPKIKNDSDDNRRAKETTLSKFDKLGLIASNEMALILAAKMSTKTRTNSIFVITDENKAQITDQIKHLLINKTSTDKIKFQIVLYEGNHAVFGEFEIDKTTQPSTVRYLHCDPLPPTTKYSAIITSTFTKEISPLANIEIYDSDATIQKGAGCTYISIDGAMMLATPSDRNYVTNVTEYMKEHGKEIEKPFEENNIKYIQSSTLPTRFIRGLQYLDDGLEVKGLNSLVFNSEEKNTVINKKGETAETVIRRDLQKRPSRFDPEKILTFNIRTERKMKQYKKSVGDFIKDKNILTPEFSNVIDNYKIGGLIKFCNDNIVRGS